MLALGCASLPAAPCPVWPSSPPAAGQGVPIGWLPTRHGTSLPVVTAVIGDQAVRLALDTGANLHMIEAGVAWWLRLPGEDAESATGILDAAGRIAVVERRGLVPLRLGDPALDRAEPLTSVAAPFLLEAGIAGVLSPQRLAPEGRAVEVDLRAGSMRVLTPAETEASAGPGWVALEPGCASDDGVPIFLVDVRIEGHLTRMIVDTGSDTTCLDARPERGWTLPQRPRRAAQRQTLGDSRPVSVLDGTEVSISGLTRRVAVDMEDIPAEDPTCPNDGRLGSDVLRSCRLVLDRDHGALLCADGP